MVEGNMKHRKRTQTCHKDRYVRSEVAGKQENRSEKSDRGDVRETEQ